MSNPYTVDRTDWPSGPWDNEPDVYTWTTHAGYTGLAKRSTEGFWFGHVVVNASSAHAGRPVSGDDYFDCDAHGGLTYAGCAGTAAYGDVSATDWMIGFDCGHLGDTWPLDKHGERGMYLPLKFVTDQCEALAHALRQTDPVRP